MWNKYPYFSNEILNIARKNILWPGINYGELYIDLYTKQWKHSDYCIIPYDSSLVSLKELKYIALIHIYSFLTIPFSKAIIPKWWQRKLYFFLSNSCNIFRQNQVPGNDVDKPESKYIQVHSYGYLWPEINLGQLRYLFADFEDIEFAAQIYLVVWE